MHMRMAGMASTIIQTRHNEFDLSQVPVWQFAARYEQANDAEDHPTPDGGLVALGNIRRNPPRLIQKIKRPPQVGGLRDSKSPIPPEKNGLTTGQSFRQNTVQARAIKCLPYVSHSLCLTGNRPWSALSVTTAGVQYFDRPGRREAAGERAAELFLPKSGGAIGPLTPSKPHFRQSALACSKRRHEPPRFSTVSPIAEACAGTPGSAERWSAAHIKKQISGSKRRFED